MSADPKFIISSLKHPDYTEHEADYQKWRLCYKGGRPFIDAYLERFSKRETTADFASRKKITYPPTFAKAAINDVKNSIYQRMAEISRLEGDKSYKAAVLGEKGGIDLFGTSMNGFIGQQILPELLIMGKVGIFVDKPTLDGELKAGNEDKRPYLYYYAAEDILSWDWEYRDGEYIYYSLLVRCRRYVYDEKVGLPKGIEEIYLHFWINGDDTVMMDTWKYDPKSQQDEKIDSKVLPLSRIPFVMLSLSASLMDDIADYQIGLLNIASSDINYIYRANFPIWTEQYDQASEPIYNRSVSWKTPAEGETELPAEQTAAQSKETSFEERKVGTVTGYRYPREMDRPGFVAPPTDPVKVSMEKQARMQDEIRMLINLSLASLQPGHASAESKKMDDRGLESGLSAIGLELEYGENEIAKIWAEYQGETKAATVRYPEKYDLKSDEDRISISKDLKSLKGAAPSKTYQQEIGKQIALTMLRGKSTPETVDKVISEIDSANYITSDPEEIKIDVEAGLVTLETASNARGYDGAKEVPVAKKEHVERLKAIAVAQTVGAGSGLGAARGVPTDAQDKSGDLEKKDSQNSDLNPTGGGSLTK